jgi:GNAT superfamily N-acetyltransferase
LCRAIHDHCRVIDRLFPSLRDFVASFAAATPGGSAFERGGVTGGIVPAMPDRSVVNSVVYSDAAELEQRLPEIADTYDQAGIAAWTVWAHEGDERAASALVAAGSVLDGEPVAMGCELAGIEAPADGELDFSADPDRGGVVEVLADAYHWDNVGDALAWYDGYHPYLALSEGRPACTLAIHDHDHDAHVTLVGTTEAARGRGLATLLMRQALADARERGATTSTLVATRLGHPVYRRVGYRDLGRVQMWERRKPDPADA